MPPRVKEKEVAHPDGGLWLFPRAAPCVRRLWPRDQVKGCISTRLIDVSHRTS